MEKASKRTRGFTLVEVLVALVVMALMALLAWRGLDGLITSRNIAQEHLDQSTRLQAVLSQWELDVRAVQDTTIVPPLGYDGATMRLTRQQPTGMQVVAWSVRNGGLYRWEGPIVQTVAALQDSYQRSQQALSQESTQLRTLDGVAGWQMYYYRGNSWSNAQSSSGTTSSTSSSVVLTPSPAASAASDATGTTTGTVTGFSSGLPTGVRMLLQFDPASGFAGPLTREIVLGPQP